MQPENGFVAGLFVAADELCFCRMNWNQDETGYSCNPPMVEAWNADHYDS